MSGSQHWNPEANRRSREKFEELERWIKYLAREDLVLMMTVQTAAGQRLFAYETSHRHGYVPLEVWNFA